MYDLMNILYNFRTYDQMKKGIVYKGLVLMDNECCLTRYE